MRNHRILGLFLALLAVDSLKAGESGKEFAVGGFVFAAPQGWELGQPSSPMRKAELKAADPKSKAVAETVFFHFGPGQGGTAADNIARWKGQVTDLAKEKVEEKDFAGTKVTLVRFEGTYQSGMPGGPKTPQPGTVLLGAILEGPQGNVFVRLTGPSALVGTLEKDFAAMIETGAKNKRG